MKTVLPTLLTTTLLYAGSSWSMDVDINLEQECSLQSGYSVKYRGHALLMTTDDGDVLRIHDGELLFNGKPIPLSSAQRAQMRDYEQQWQAMLPLSRDVAIEALASVQLTVEEMADALAELDLNTAEQLRDRLHEGLERIRESVQAHIHDDGVDEKALEQQVQQAIRQLLPGIMGDAMRLGLKLALEQDEEKLQRFEQKMQALEPRLKARFENENSPLKQQVMQLCQQFRHIDELEQALQLSLPNSNTLDAVRFRE